jgi:hypothetical protein
MGLVEPTMSLQPWEGSKTAGFLHHHFLGGAQGKPVKSSLCLRQQGNVRF